MDCKTAQQKIMPYIERKLNDREMEEFIEHVRGCEACSEELEVYFTIYYALAQLDNEENEVYNIKELLEKDLKQAEDRVKKHNIVRFYRRFFMTLLGIVAGIFLITGAQTLLTGSFEYTTLYNLFSVETEPVTWIQSETQESEPQITEATERETNRKRQPIVTTPETEAAIPLSETVAE
ncbi:hypothetical protein BRYFOR_06433 [Marvinbryantia formatexigens DSM 14469]|uniref:Anti-sigma-W factor RsiW n=1 Tax=Marvinbryantia formatexigens DSM 14469 TaxID=478749 RepID=C6LCT6_9FIRM|nr:zf-HC2 domain-containing protein [Marvinbryantia formatexigens]EET61750.1 hypothetical protein BRYFOR_06433 [Marvinbryantia formatexigens DSM 14469]UWO24440.1 zf-HC2 domain-containing protein [Marvinbryantia formatexigens DSM 14469]SDF07806.1 Putative zinc-finger [Marvinbryantia formatexigens]